MTNKTSEKKPATAAIQAHILLVEDDNHLAFVIRDNLERKGYSVTYCKDGLECYEIFKKESFDLCLLDIMMPRMDGITLAEKIRQKNSDIPILFLSAKSMLDDRLAAFRIGGDDYLMKPFSMDELLFKIEVFLRRSRTFDANTETPNQYTIGRFTLDFRNLMLHRDTSSSPLTLREAEVLAYFARRPNELINRNELLSKIWGSNDYFLGRSLDVFISRLRKLLKDDPSIAIENIHGVGFRLAITP